MTLKSMNDIRINGVFKGFWLGFTDSVTIIDSINALSGQEDLGIPYDKGLMDDSCTMHDGIGSSVRVCFGPVDQSMWTLNISFSV